MTRTRTTMIRVGGALNQKKNTARDLLLGKLALARKGGAIVMACKTAHMLWAFKIVLFTLFIAVIGKKILIQFSYFQCEMHVPCEFVFT